MKIYGLKNNEAQITFNLWSNREILINVVIESLGADKDEAFHNLALTGRNSLLTKC